MDGILQANIFFFITSVAVILFTVLLCFAVYQVIKILKSIRRIVDRIDEGSEMIAGDMDSLRTFVTEGSLVSQLVGFFLGNRSAIKKTRSIKRKRSGTKIAINED